MGLTVSAEEIIRDRKILRRESFLNLSWNSYLMSKLIILFSLSAIQTLTFVLVGNLILEVKGMTFAFWLVLFSTSCFANVLGLNISSAFRSAVTVYIMIPLLLIPQMILSGLLFSFDKLNNLISTKGKVPIIADVMASRWAYEAMAVHQFKNNDYEQSFYEYERDAALADFKAAYMADELARKNEYVLDNIENKNDTILRKMASELSVLRRSLEKEPFRKGLESINLDEALQPGAYTKAIGQSLSKYLDEYRNHYQKIYNEQSRIIEQKKVFFQKQGFDLAAEKDAYYNESLADLVKNVTAESRLLEFNGNLIQQINPVFQYPSTDRLLNYRTAFFFPEKNLLGMSVSTFLFDLLVIWVMSLLCYVTLYFELLRKLVNSFGSVHFPIKI
jgi:hypothetical protein